MAKEIRSIEEQVEDLAKKQLKTKYFTKTESINEEIETALKIAPSKTGGIGANYPDIKLFIKTKDLRYIPVMIEVKGRKGDLVSLDDNGDVENKKKDGTPNYANIRKYAVNGAVHYANAIIANTTSYKEVIAIGINGYYEGDALVTEIGVYYLSQKNFCIPKKIGDYTDLSFLQAKNIPAFIERIDNVDLTDEEIERKAKEFENEIETKLKKLNQTMQDTLKISVGSRVELVAGMIMAGLGVENKVAPLTVAELKGESGSKSNDGHTIINKIDSFLEERNLPQEKKAMIINDLSRVFIYSDLWKPVNGESKLKSVYTIVKNDIMPVFTSAKHLDFTGKLFNVLNEWVDIPDSDKNDVVMTPRYVTELMAKLARVNMGSYVWDYATGSAGFLVSSMKLMIKDAEARINSPEELANTIEKIKREQLLGIEKRADIYLLAVLNMILMGDGSSNIVHEDSLTEYRGKYEQGDLKGNDFPANVFLLNPPYSAPGKGFVFVEKALSRMKSGRAVILIQENAGSKSGLPYTKAILKNNSLVASIHMADIFKGKAGVQTAIYVFDVGTPHNEKQIVKFIDFSNDGYTRQNRKKATQKTNLKNTDHALERYEEVVNLVLFGKSYLHYFKESEYIEDTISLNGDDWTFAQHVKVNTTPCEADFRCVIKEYMSWKSSAQLGDDGKAIIENFPIHYSADIPLNSYGLSEKELSAVKQYRSSGVKTAVFTAEKLFSVNANPQLNKDSFRFTDRKDGTYPYFTRTVTNNGIAGYVEYLDEDHKIAGNSIAVGMLQNLFFYMDHDFYAGQFTKTLVPTFRGFNEAIAKYFITWFNKSSVVYCSVLVRDFEKYVNSTKLTLPVTETGEVDFEFIKNFIKAQEKILLKDMESFWMMKLSLIKQLG